MIDSKSQVKTKENKTPHNNSEREQQPFGRALEPFRCLSRWRRESRLSFLHLLCCSGIIHPGNLSKCRWPTDRAPETVVSVKVSSRQDLSELMGGPQWSRLGVQSLAKGVWGTTAKVGSSGTEKASRVQLLCSSESPSPPAKRVIPDTAQSHHCSACSVRSPNTAVGFVDALTLIRFTHWDIAGPAPCPAYL